MTNVDLEISRDEAVVLFELLSRFVNDDAWTIEDGAELRVLWNLQTELASSLEEPSSKDFPVLLAEARARVRDEGATDADSEVASGRLSLWLSPSQIAFLANEWRSLPKEITANRKEQWSQIAFRAIAALHKAGISYNPVWSEESGTSGDAT